MTAKQPSAGDDLGSAQRARRQGKGRLAIATAGDSVTSVAAAVTGDAVTGDAAALGQRGWLTTTLRPAGPLDQPGLLRLTEALGALAASSDMVIVDLTAANVVSPHALARRLRAPALRFQLAGRCLLLVGASPALTTELDRAAVPVVTLAADALPLPVA